MKLGFEVSGEWSRKLAALTLLANAIESIIAEYGCSRICVMEPRDLNDVIHEDLVLCYDGCEEIPTKGFELDEMKSLGLISKYEFVPCPTSSFKCISESTVLSYVSRYFNDMVSYVRSYALKTALEGREYIVVILRNGRAALLEGEEGKVQLPDIGIIASAHTHPRGCIPSPHDVRTLINTLFNGGAGIAITSVDCTLKLIRCGPFTEDDFIELQKFRSHLRKGDLSKVREVIKRGYVSKNVKVLFSIE